jgi:DNA-binding NarL/FixJ family response regulator
LAWNRTGRTAAVSGCNCHKPDGARKTILVVEDSQDDVFFLERAIKRAETANPIQITHDETGFEVLNWMRSRSELAQITVSVLTSSDEARYVEQNRQFGVAAYLIKPAIPVTLQYLLSQLQS